MRSEYQISRTISILMFLLAGILFASVSHASENKKLKFKRVPYQFIAALGDPKATSGVGAEKWGYWDVDPGPRGVWLTDYPMLVITGNVSRHGWAFDYKDWWLDENGLIMEKPTFPIKAGNYLVTGERETITVLTVHPKDENGEQRWELAHGAQLYDVTHLPCRSARYTQGDGAQTCSPKNAPLSRFKVPPGSIMPDIPGCKRQDYAVLIVIGREVIQ